MVGLVVPLQPPSILSPRRFSPSQAWPVHASLLQTLTRLVPELDSDRPLSTLTVKAVTVAVTTAWGGRAPATWNRQVATVRSSWGSASGSVGWSMTSPSTSSAGRPGSRPRRGSAMPSLPWPTAGGPYQVTDLEAFL
jgi:hypothetical protein